MKGIRLEEHSPDGTRKPIGIITTTDTVIGRDPGLGLKVERGSISRRHGVFFIFGHNWCYKDIGSTNGSWHNGRPLKQDQVCLIRPGDRLQLADTFIAISPTDYSGIRTWDEEAPPGGSVLVFNEGNPVHEFRIPHMGKVITVGGSSANVELPTYQGEPARLIVESKSGDIILEVSEGAQSAATVNLNGKPVNGTLQLHDRDEISCGPLSIFIDTPLVSKSAESDLAGVQGLMPQMSSGSHPSPVEQILPRADSGASFSTWESDERAYEESGESNPYTEFETGPRKSHNPLNTFGQLSDPIGEDQPSELADILSSHGGVRTGLPPSARRFTTASIQSPASRITPKDRIFALIGFLFFVAVLVFAVWYSLS